MKSLIFLLLFFVLVAGCINKKEKEANRAQGSASSNLLKLKTVNPTKILFDKKHENIHTKSFIEETKIIRLKAPKDIVIGQVRSIQCANNKYYIKDETGNSLFCFNKSGEFLFQINADGKGANEISTIGNFFVKPEKNELYIFDNILSRLNKYASESGEFISQTQFRNKGARPIYNISSVSGDKYLTILNNLNSGHRLLNYNVLLFDGDSLASRNLPIPPHWQNFNFEIYPSLYFNSKFSYYNSPDQTYYEIDLEQNSIQKKYILDFGEKDISNFLKEHNHLKGLKVSGSKRFTESSLQLRKKLAMSDLYGPVRGCIETSDYLWIKFMNKGQYINSIYSKALKQNVILGRINTYSPIYKCILGSHLLTSDQNSNFVSVGYPLELINKFKDLKDFLGEEEYDKYLEETPKEKELIQTLKEDDNPVIVLFSIKNN